MLNLHAGKPEGVVTIGSKDLLGAFDEWWSSRGQYLDPDTDDVPWFDKRRGLAEMVWDVAMAQSRNYVADQECEPKSVTFKNGRTVKVKEGYLEVEAPNADSSQPAPKI